MIAGTVFIKGIPDIEALSSLLEANTSFFVNPALHAEYRSVESYGMLPRKYYESAVFADYVIYSYATPIAWKTGDNWHVPDELYTNTTSRYQGLIRDALAQMGEIWITDW